MKDNDSGDKRKKLGQNELGGDERGGHRSEKKTSTDDKRASRAVVRYDRPRKELT